MATLLDYAFQAWPSSSPLWREGRSLGVLAILGSAIRWFSKEANSRTVADAFGFVLAIGGMTLGFFALGAQGINKFAVAALGLGISALGFIITVAGALHLIHFIDDNIPNPFEFVPSSITLISTAIGVANFAQAASETVL